MYKPHPTILSLLLASSLTQAQGSPAALTTNNCKTPAYIYFSDAPTNGPQMIPAGATQSAYLGVASDDGTLTFKIASSPVSIGDSYVETTYLAARRGLYYAVKVFGVGFEAGKIRLAANANSSVACPGVVEVQGQDIKWVNSTGTTGQGCRTEFPGLVLDLCV